MICKWYNKNMASNPLIPGKKPIVTDEIELADPWKVDRFKGGLIRSGAFTGSGRGASGGGNGGGDNPDPNGRPSLSDITLVGFDSYYDAAGMVRIKAKFRVYNSSGEDLEKFAVAVTISDTKGGRA